MSDLVKRLYNFHPSAMLRYLGFSLGDERNNEGNLVGFANIPQKHGGGSLDLAIFGPRYEPFKVCVEAAEKIEKLEKELSELKASRSVRKEKDLPNG